VGAVDGILIRIEKLEWGASLYFNYKHYCSVVLLAVADSNVRFVSADAGSYGKDSDASIFRNSSLWQKLLHRQSLTHVKPAVMWTAPVHTVKHCSARHSFWSVVAWPSKSKMQDALQRSLWSTHVGCVVPLV
jgi:hypothetical protein